MFYIEKRNRKKDGKGYCCLVCDLGYRYVVLSYDMLLLSEILGVSAAELYSMKEGDKRYVKL